METTGFNNLCLFFKKPINFAFRCDELKYEGNMNCWPKHEIPKPNLVDKKLNSLTENIHVNVFEVISLWAIKRNLIFLII